MSREIMLATDERSTLESSYARTGVSYFPMDLLISNARLQGTSVEVSGESEVLLVKGKLVVSF